MGEFISSKAVTKMQVIIIVAIIIVVVVAGALYSYFALMPAPAPAPSPAPPPTPPPPPPPTPVTIKAGYIVPAENIISLFEIPFFQENVLENYGKKYTVDLLRLRSTPDIVAALAAGELHVGHLALISFASAVVRDVVPSGLIIIAGDAFDAYPGYYSFTCLTLADSPINTAKDLAGKKIGINALGTAVHFAAAAVLKANGLDPKKDVIFVEVGPFPALAPALKEKKIDAGIFPPAYYWPIIGEGIYKESI
ncbi:MAG: PhnD/SsuA/transferrin family substrate-binding protein [Candidatus Bathyarchaeia archaeon]